MEPSYYKSALCSRNVFMAYGRLNCILFICIKNSKLCLLFLTQIVLIEAYLLSVRKLYLLMPFHNHLTVLHTHHCRTKQFSYSADSLQEKWERLKGYVWKPTQSYCRNRGNDAWSTSTVDSTTWYENINNIRILSIFCLPIWMPISRPYSVKLPR